MKGTITRGSTSRVDYCLGSRQVNEFYCNTYGNIIDVTLSCSSGKTCIDGACVTSSQTTNQTINAGTWCGLTSPNGQIVSACQGIVTTQNCPAGYQSKTIPSIGTVCFKN